MQKIPNQKLLGLNILGTIEVKPGIAPTPKHVMTIVNLMKKGEVDTIVGATYFPEYKMKNIAQKVGAELILLKINADPKNSDIMKKFDDWIDELLKGD